ncbi:MAG: leucine--tRNA ligase [Candidatus Komeilibacteria bacterium CG11_big_fil_rev_8_21_14_0_20_36_20]|uniref:Leucine--tRNA ligase n=1 Tax=Candidatus Komeilibacteria bacterium CG11_big_fil_rev_8_21_14_0_20_36_20 TaxID=1974477 RepID=A0A2H0NCT1_9BACT|nr:MAG: leucine--tRNA ligase [Candidatus Komeilibacteria bacterium CG11_big_fil_rev_8_21_14_0_20_36_20]PIR81515.1 MAG: leucine--tRNA ligase [Candidatus Komeilibacteria bacterium CG10_big_fil_rev_8_21_14_0_10_36_65]PJC55709.1 MAG: leucine--tRNA ligase [Candidatus Komeilibacteria bacterium CG_4_9_14_0_2_um_filter_36_13]
MVESRKYLPQKIEEKWQKFWEKNQIFVAKELSKQDKFYGLVEFPYPSGDGLHTGHLRSYTAMDIICRYQRMKGFNVLYPMGFDAFGLPAENYAVKKKIAPQIITQKNIANFQRQMKSIGFSFDWSRAFSTTDQDYYRWTQWIFVQLFKKGLAYKAKENINWCTSCQIGLANEEVVDGVCERCGGEVVKKEKEQWILKITNYADRLINDLDKVDFLEQIKKQQIDWIGRSEGVECKFKVKSEKSKVDEELVVFTTRPDTLFGVTFMVVSPEHQVIAKLKNKIKNLAEVEKYIKAAKKKTDLERTDLSKEKTGVELKGIRAVNPVNGKEIPIFVADYVLVNYGTGAIMAVPAHDERDFEFAKKYDLEIREVITPMFYGPDEVRVDKKMVPRTVVHAFVRHWSEDKYLCLDWGKYGWHTAVVGGINQGETVEEAGIREVQEETGYQNLKFIKQLPAAVHHRCYLRHKDENRYAICTAVLFQLKNDQKIGPDKEELAKHKPVWVDKDQVFNFFNLENMKIEWRKLQGEQVCYFGEGVAINSGEFTGLETAEFKKKIIKWLGKNKLGRGTVNYKLRDWIFSRQRYWGEPIPMVYCAKCGWQPVLEKDLPVILPDIKDFMPTKEGDSPLAKVKDWIKTSCPECHGPAKRETDVMPNWAGSNWYFIRYCDPQNKKQLADLKKLKYWLPINWYNGGMEHTTLHLLYSRFIFKFLYDIGAIPKSCGSEPYVKRTAQGMILGKGGVKMSKSKGNVVNPDEYVAKYGADATRLYIMFMGPFDQDVVWSDKGVIGMKRFLETIWEIIANERSQSVEVDGPNEEKLNLLLNKTIKKVSEDISQMKFNTAISAMMIFINQLRNLRVEDSQKMQIIYEKFLKILSPFAPYITEELWSQLGNKKSITEAAWPAYDQKLISQDNIILVIQINGKVRDQVELRADTEDSPELQKEILSRPKIKKILGNRKIKKFIYIKNKIISIVIN